MMQRYVKKRPNDAFFGLYKSDPALNIMLKINYLKIENLNQNYAYLLCFS